MNESQIIATVVTILGLTLWFGMWWSMYKLFTEDCDDYE